MLVLIVIVSACVTLPPVLVALTVIGEFVTAAVGVPEISPVLPLSDNPVGHVPESRVHVTPLPVPASVWLYALSIVPLGNDVVVIVGGGGGVTIVIESDFVTLPPVLVTLTTKLNVFAAEGVPEITPAVERSKSSGNGSEPVLSSHVKLVGYPVATSLWLYATPTVPPSIGDVVVIVGGPLIVIESCFEALPTELVAVTVILNIPEAVGVPPIVPVVCVIPAGNVPVTVHVGAGYPVAASAWLYTELTSPASNDWVVIAGGAFIVIERLFVPSSVSLVTLKVIEENNPPVVGIPEIMPVLALSVNPAGKSEPVSSSHVKGAVPDALSCWLYGIPTVPGSNVVVVTVGPTAEAVIINESDCATLPLELVALTMKLNVPGVIVSEGVPEITPAAESVKPAGNGSEPKLSPHVIGVVPVAVSVWVYGTSIAPSCKNVVVIAGIVGDGGGGGAGGFGRAAIGRVSL
jgi:hypothetical protein